MRKKIFIFTLIVILIKIAAAQKFYPGLTKDIAFKEQKTFAQKLSFQENTSYGLWDLTYQRMNWKIDPAVRFIQGEITSYFKSKADELTEIEFDLQDDMVVDSVYHHSQKIGFTHTENIITIPFEDALTIGSTDSVTVFYHGIPSDEGNDFGSFARSIHGANQVPIIWTLSEPYGAMVWWPCKQSLSDKIDSIDIIITSPEPYRTASNGILNSETVNDEFRTMHWRHRFPIATYLVAIAVTNYVDYTDTLKLEDGRQIDIVNFVYPENLESAKSSTPVTAEIMELFNTIISEYPFAKEKYGHAQFGWPGGMEHQTMSFMHNFNFDLVAHELAHQWFGDYITLASWQDIWLNEGFATFLTGLAYENLLDGKWWPVWKRSNVERIISIPGGSVFVQDTTDISRIFSGRLSYSKGAYLLHMLRWVLGDENFFNALRNYYNDPQVANGFANNEQFVNHLEESGDTTLSEFFNDWYYGEGYPVYSLEYSKTDATTYWLKLSQTTSHPSVDFFEMPVPIRVYNSEKTDSTEFTLIHTQNNQEYFIDPRFEIDSIKIDPDYWLISKTSGIVSTISERINANDLKIYPNPVQDAITLQISGSQKLLTTEIFTFQGKKIKQFNGGMKRLNLSGLPGGVYILRIKTSKNEFIRKIEKW